MQLRFIEIRQFQRFGHGVRIDTLDPGLNVIAGPNEEGKSTLLRAVRAALFERHKAQPVTDEYRPFGQSVEPEVRLGLRIGDVDYEVHKVFSRRVSGRTVLESASGDRWQNEDAEAKLESLLGFTHAGRGRSSSELQGPAGLLWVSQGEAYKPVAPAQEHLRLLHATLDSSLTAMLGGNQGDRLHGRVTALFEESYDKRGQPRGELRSAQAALSQLTEKLAEARSALERFEARADLLAEKQRRLDDCVAQRVLERAREQLDTARDRDRRLSARRQQVDEARQALKLASAHLQQASSAWQTRQGAAAALQESTRKLAAADTRADTAREALDRLTPALAAAQCASAQARARRDHAQLQSRLLTRWMEREQMVREEERIRAQLENAQHADCQRRALLAERSGLSVDRKLVSEMEDLLQRRDRLESGLKAGAARLDFELQRGQSALLDGQPIRDTGSVPVLSATQLRIDGVGRFTVHPGAAGAATGSTSDLEDMDRRLGELLQRAGADSVEDARRALRRKEELDNRLEVLKTALAVHAPRGLDALRDSAARLARALADLGRELDATRRPDADPRQLEAEADASRRAADTAVEALQGLESEATGLREQLAGAQADQVNARRDHQASTGALAAARAEVDDASLARAVAARRNECERQRLELEALELALAAEDPDAAALSLARAEEVYRNRNDELGTLTQDCRELRVELRTLGQQGVAERAADLESAHERASRRLLAVSRRAEAVKLLHQVMSEALDRAKHSVSRPIVERLGPYIAKVIPGAAPLIDENLALGGLLRESNEQAFDALSMGTREQIAVLTRLAYADTLAQSGAPVCVLLDDALVNTDDERLERMHTVLFEASRRYQIVILTCHPRAYENSGARLVRLQDCRLDPA